MREILFRGKRMDNREWIYGDLLQNIDAVKIREQEKSIHAIAKSFTVDPETVGQYTGLKDKNGREIYEGDICGCFCNTQLFEVKYCSERCGYFFDDCILSGGCEPAPECLGNLENTIEVIGNIHDNPELLEENKQ